eukprot:397750_1
MKLNKERMPIWQKCCHRNIAYILFVAIGLIVTIYEIPTMNTNSIRVDTHQFDTNILNNINIGDNFLNGVKRPDLEINSNRNDDNLSHKTVFITGIAGFIGMSLAKQLSNKTQFPYTNVIGIDSFNTYYIPKLKRERGQTLIRMGVNVIFGDLCNELLITDIFKTYNISIVVHLAAQAGVRYSIQYPHSYVRNNIDCTVYLLEIIKKLKLSIPIVYASSSSIYGDNNFKNEPLKDTVAVNNYKPKSVYAASKIATENMASVYSKMYNLTMVGLRFFTVYGSFGRPDMALWTFTDRLLNNKKIKLYNNGDMMRDFTHWNDIVNGIELSMKYALKKNMYNKIGSNEIFNLGKGNVRSLYDFVKIILLNLDMSIDIKSNNLIELAPTPGGEVLFTSADLNKSNALLGYNPKIELEIGVPEFIKWYKNDWIIKERIDKKYLLISTFYISMRDPRRKQNNINYSYDFKFAIEYINNWYKSIKYVMNISNLKLSQLDCVIIHDGLSSDIFEYFEDIIFINMGQFPNGYSHKIRKSPNDIRYFHISNYLENSDTNEYEIVIITDLHDVTFGQNPFTYIENKGINNNNNNDLYIGCEVLNIKQTFWHKIFNSNNELE